MNLGARHKVDPSFNMSSMTDIVFLLLIFFMLTSNFQKLNKVPNNLPKGGTSVVESTKIAVTIMANGDIFVGDSDRKYTIGTLKEVLDSKLSKGIEDRLKETVTILGDSDINYGTIVEVINIAHQLGTKSSLALNAN